MSPESASFLQQPGYVERSADTLIMYWVNTIVDRVGKEPPGEHDPEKGKRKQSFE